MTHLTEVQILAYVDGSADYMTQATYTNHLATCEQCRREAELQKNIMRTARSAGFIVPSRGFTRRVMLRIVPPRTRAATRWVLDNMGAMFAMMAVAGVTGAVVWGERSPGDSGMQLPKIHLTSVMETAGGMLKGFVGAVTDGLSFIQLPPITGEENLVLIATSVVALALLDRLFRARFMRTSRQ